MNLRTKVARAIGEANHGRQGHDAITAFLEGAAEQGWHMRPDEAGPDMYDAGEAALDKDGHAGDAYLAMLAAAPEFEWDK